MESYKSEPMSRQVAQGEKHNLKALQEVLPPGVEGKTWSAPQTCLAGLNLWKLSYRDETATLGRVDY